MRMWISVVEIEKQSELGLTGGHLPYLLATSATARSSLKKPRIPPPFFYRESR